MKLWSHLFSLSLSNPDCWFSWIRQLLVDSMPLVWREWEGTATMSHTISMPSTCTTCTGWSIRGWRWLFPCWEQLASALESLCTQSFSSRRRPPQVERSCSQSLHIGDLFSTTFLWSFKLDSTLVVAYYDHVFLREVVTSFLAMFSSRTQLSVNNIVAWTFQAVEKPQQWYHLLLCGFLSRYLCWARVPGVTFWGVTCLPTVDG